MKLKISKWLNGITSVIPLSFLVVAVTACGGGGGAGSGGSSNNPSGYNIGILKHSGGATVWISSNNFDLSGNKQLSGSIGVRGGNTGTYNVSLSIVPNNLTTANISKAILGLPEINFSNCTLVPGGFPTSCNFTLSSTSTTINGKYKLIPVFTKIGTESQPLDPIGITVSGSSNPIPGNLTITPNTQKIIVGGSSTATVSLSNSVGVFESIAVNLNSSNPDILKVTPLSCNLNSINNSCEVNLTAPAVGSATLTAASTGYAESPVTFNVLNQSYVYVTNSNGNIAMFKIDPNSGILIPLNPATINSAIGGQQIAADPKGNYLYVNDYNHNKILMYKINSNTGILTPLSPASIDTDDSPNHMAIDPTGNYFYITTINNNPIISKISMYQINRNTGQLTAIPGLATVGAGLRAVIVDKSGRFLYTIDTQQSKIFMYNINSNTGVLSPLSPESTVATGSGAYRMTISPSNLYAYVTNSDDNTISTYSINQTTGLLMLVNSQTPTGGAPIGITIDPTGRYIYAVNDSFQDSSVSMFGINLNTGLPSGLTPAKIFAGKNPWDIVVDPTGQYVYVTNNFDSTLSMYRITPNTGILVSLSPASVASGGTNPVRIIVVTPNPS